MARAGLEVRQFWTCFGAGGLASLAAGAYPKKLQLVGDGFKAVPSSKAGLNLGQQAFFNFDHI